MNHPTPDTTTSDHYAIENLLDLFEGEWPPRSDDEPHTDVVIRWVAVNLAARPPSGPYTHLELEGLACIAGCDLDDAEDARIFAAGITFAEATRLVTVVCDHHQPTDFCLRLRFPDPKWVEEGNALAECDELAQIVVIQDLQRRFLDAQADTPVDGGPTVT